MVLHWKTKKKIMDATPSQVALAMVLHSQILTHVSATPSQVQKFIFRFSQCFIKFSNWKMVETNEKTFNFYFIMIVYVEIRLICRNNVLMHLRWCCTEKLKILWSVTPSQVQWHLRWCCTLHFFLRFCTCDVLKCK